MPSLLQVENLEVKFALRMGELTAIDGVSFRLERGERLGLVGESGAGKSVTGFAVINLISRPGYISGGQILFEGIDLAGLSAEQMRDIRGNRISMIFQDPYASLNPRKTVRQTLEEPVVFHNRRIGGGEVKDRVSQVMEQVGVDPGWAGRYPHEFSGGQRQRISIARALTVAPEFIVADEPVSALDVSIQAQILNLLMKAQEDLGLTYMFITHDLSVVRHISTRVAVMYLGTLCEVASADTLFASPRHPYTQALLSAIPKLGAEKKRHVKLKGEVPTPIRLPSGCVFHGRCIHVNHRCREEVPRLRHLSSGSWTACHRVEEGRI
ncbi:MAG: ABC transporter ATP-binding protein [Desulfobacterales bacterium]|nr:ABC transporter ATP-binding protein [Desulfobacterales bacterium]